MCPSTPAYDPVLFGRDAAPSVTAVELEGNRHVRIYAREPSRVSSTAVPFEPFLWLTSEDRLAGWKGECRIEPLAGTHAFRRLAFFPGMDSLESARAWLLRKSGKSQNAPGLPFLYLRDPVEQYLVGSGTTHFNGMRFDRLLRMQVDLEVYRTAGFEFPNPLREGDRITAVAMSDSSGWERLISGRDHDEGTMLVELVREVRERDPDVIEGHNFFRFDLPYVEERARRHGVSLTLGRDGSRPRRRSARFLVGDRVIPYRHYEIHGRHVIDTWFLAQRHSRADRTLKRNGLKDVARHFGVAAPDRTYISGAEANWYFDHDPDTLFRYALDDVRETRAISAALSPGCYLQAQIFPCRYQDMALVDEATAIDRLMLREYHARLHSVPGPMNPGPVTGKVAESRIAGVSRRVLRCELNPIYAAVMRHGHCRPRPDDLEVFPALLRGLQELQGGAAPVTEAAPERDPSRFMATARADLAVLVDALHGYLAAPAVHFNDHEAADRVTRAGGEHVRRLAEGFEVRGARVVTMDPGGIYLVPPADVADGAAEQALVEAATAAALPWKVDLPLARYRAMFCCGAEDHALLDHEDGLSLNGPRLNSRGLERYRRKWLEEMLRLLLDERKGEIPALYEQYREALTNHRVDLSLLKRTETLRESLDEYQMKVKGGKQHPRGAYEVALRSERRYLAGDQVSCYVAGEGAKVIVNENCRHVSEWDPASPDENVDYYKARLRDLYEQFRPFFVEE
ncbi:MAG: DNA polymerase II [Deltaproteobacteria bacterium]|nr:DNA polymerase II [Deltaproteobacteria bacterium]